jgi:hypothetical protein
MKQFRFIEILVVTIKVYEEPPVRFIVYNRFLLVPLVP